MDHASALLPVLLFVAAALAGCTDGGGGDGTTETDVPFVADIPRWDVGDSWTYTVQTSEFPQTSAKMVVYDDDGDRYWVGVTDREQALVHALFNVNPQLGRIQKGNLAVYEKGEPRAMYRFPIHDGDTWTTDLFVSIHGGTLTAKATHSDAVATPFGTFEGFDIVATNGAGFRVEYDFVPQLKWFTKLVVHDSDGTLLHDLRVTESGTAPEGTKAWFVRGTDLQDPGDQVFTGADCGGLQGCSRPVLVDGASEKGGKYGPFTVVAYNVQVHNPGGQTASVTITDGAGDTVYSDGGLLQSPQGEFEFRTTRDFAPGQWQVQVRASGQTTITVRLAGAWEYCGIVGQDSCTV